MGRCMFSLFPILALLPAVAFCAVQPNELRGNFDLVGGPVDCPNTIRTTRVRPIPQRETVEIDVPAISMGGSNCNGRGYVIMARQTGALSPTINTTVSLTTVLRRGGGGGGGRGGGGGSSRGGGGSSRGGGGGRNRGGRHSRGISGGGSRGVLRPSSSGPIPVKGSRIKSGGMRGTAWLGAAFIASRGWRGGKGKSWRKRRKSIDGDEDDDVSELSEKLDRLNISHYYGFHARPSLAKLSENVANFTQWGFQCGRYGAEFRTRFLYFRLSDRATASAVGGFYAPNVNYLIISGSTYNGESTRNPTVPCVYTSREHSTGRHSANVSDNQPVDCLAGDAMVTMADGTASRVDELNEGDEVARGRQIFMFTHRDEHKVARFHRFTSTAGHTLELTPGHYLYVNGLPRAARNVRVGDTLQRADGGVVAVREVTDVMKKGVYNPQTVQGDIEVNGFVVSTYTEAIQPTIAHSALSPLRAVWIWAGWTTRALYGGMPRVLRGATE